MVSLLCCIFLISSICISQALENGLARTPPMGWLDWERFRCNRNCKTDPNDCIGELLIKQMADRIVSDGFHKVGYEYVIIDDCWLAPNRDKNGRLVPEVKQFPSGMKALADYVHSKGLKLGIYQDYGIKTCAGYPGMKYYMQIDAQTFADWGVDYLKLDTCNAGDYQFTGGYPPIAFYLNITGRPIVLSCEYPLYQSSRGIKPNYPELVNACNLARTHTDIQDGWDSLLSIIESYGINSFNASKYAQPGYWNDPDMLIVGDFGLSFDQERVQFGMYAMFAAPLIMSVDLRDIRNESRSLLLNPHVISINQDPLGRQGYRVFSKSAREIWLRELSGNHYAIAYLYLGTDLPVFVGQILSKIGLNHTEGYKLYDGFTGDFIGKYRPTDLLSQKVNPSGIFLGRLIPL